MPLSLSRPVAGALPKMHGGGEGLDGGGRLQVALRTVQVAPLIRSTPRAGTASSTLSVPRSCYLMPYYWKAFRRLTTFERRRPWRLSLVERGSDRAHVVMRPLAPLPATRLAAAVQPEIHI